MQVMRWIMFLKNCEHFQIMGERVRSMKRSMEEVSHFHLTAPTTWKPIALATYGRALMDVHLKG